MDTIVEKQGNSCWMLLVPKDTVFVDDQKFYVFVDDFRQPPGAWTKDQLDVERALNEVIPMPWVWVKTLYWLIKIAGEMDVHSEYGLLVRYCPIPMSNLGDIPSFCQDGITKYALNIWITNKPYPNRTWIGWGRWKKKSGAGADVLTLWCSTSQKQRDSTRCCSQGQDDSFGYDFFAKLPLHSMDGCCSRGLAKMGVHAPFTTLCFPFQPPDCHNRKWSCQNGRLKKMDGRSNLGIYWNIVKCLFRP